MYQQLIVGTINNRHDMPCKEYIFNKDITDPNNFRWFEEYAMQWLANKMKYLNVQPSMTNEPKYRPASALGMSKELYLETPLHLVVYVTGLNAVTQATLNAARRLHIHKITLAHWDLDSQDYLFQDVVY